MKDIKQTRRPSNLRRDHPWMHAFSYVCSLPAGQVTKTAVTPFDPLYLKTPCCTQTSLLYVWQELLPIEVLHCGNRNFKPFWLLWPWAWPDDLHVWTQPVVHGDILHVQMWTFYVKLSKVIIWQTYRQTRPKLYTTLLCAWSKSKTQKSASKLCDIWVQQWSLFHRLEPATSTVLPVSCSIDPVLCMVDNISAIICHHLARFYTDAKLYHMVKGQVLYSSVQLGLEAVWQLLDCKWWHHITVYKYDVVYV